VNLLEVARYLGNVTAGAVDVNLFDSKFSTGVDVVAQEHLTEATDAQMTTALPLTWCSRSC